MAIDLKAIGPFLAAAAGYAVLGPEGGTLGAVLGGGIGAILPEPVAKAASEQLSSAANDYLKERIPDMLEDWKKNQADASRIKLNHTILQALANSIAEQIARTVIPDWPDLPKAWATAIQKVAEDPNKLPALFRTASERLDSNNLSEAQILTHLSQPAELEKLFWTNLRDYLVRVVDHRNIIATDLPEDAKRTLIVASDGFPKKERLAVIEGLKPLIFEGLTRAYAQQVAGEKILRDKSLFYLAQANGAKADEIDQKVERLISAFESLKEKHLEALISALTGNIEAIVQQTFQTALDKLRDEINQHTTSEHERTRRLIESQAPYELRTVFHPNYGVRQLVSRPDLIRLLHDEMTKSSSVAVTALAAYGDGGVGKSVLAELYATHFLEHHPNSHVIWFDMSEGASLKERFATYDVGESDSKTQDERADRIAKALARPPIKLLVLDNIEDEVQWTKIYSSGLLPGAHCQILVTTRDQNILPASQVVIERLTREEALALLDIFVPGISESRFVEKLLDETERIAVFVAAVGATLKKYKKPVEQYLELLNRSPITKIDEKVGAPGYPKRAAAILQALRDSLSPATLRALDLAAFLPVTGFEKAWLEEVLAKFKLDPELHWEEFGGEMVDVSYYLDELLTRRLLEEVPGTERYRLHRVHRRYAQELPTDPTEQIRLLSPVFGLAERLFTIATDDNHHSNAVPNLTDVIAIREELGKFLYPLNRWAPEHQNDLAKAYASRGNAQQAVPDIIAAIRDYGSAIKVMKQIRDTLEPQGRWDPQYQNLLAASYMNRGNAQQAIPDINAAIRDYESAIKIHEKIRDTLKPQGSWDLEYQNNLAVAYVNRGNAQQSVPDIKEAIKDYEIAIQMIDQLKEILAVEGRWYIKYQNNLANAYMSRGTAHQAMENTSLAIQDYTRSIQLMEQIRETLEPQGQWATSYQNHLANAYMNRGNSHQSIPDSSTAILDYSSAIQLMEQIRITLDPKGRWSLRYQNDLALAYSNRGTAHQEIRNVTTAIDDYGSAIQVMEQIRDTLMPLGRWDPPYQNHFAIAYMNRGWSRQAIPEISSAILDYGDAIQVMEQIRDTLKPQGRWDPHYQNSLARAYRNRALAYLGGNQVPLARQDLLKSSAVLMDLIGKYPCYFEGEYLKCIAILHFIGEVTAHDGEEAIRLCEVRLTPAQRQAANFERLAPMIRQTL